MVPDYFHLKSDFLMKKRQKVVRLWPLLSHHLLRPWHIQYCLLICTCFTNINLNSSVLVLKYYLCVIWIAWLSAVHKRHALFIVYMVSSSWNFAVYIYFSWLCGMWLDILRMNQVGHFMSCHCCRKIWCKCTNTLKYIVTVHNY